MNVMTVIAYPGVKKVEHVYFYGADVSTPEMRRGWLDQAYQLGKDYQSF